MRHAWIDITAGVAGDMLLGALLDAGADLARVQEAVEAVIPGSVRITTEQVSRAGQRALKAHVTLLAEDPPHRTWRMIRELLSVAELSEPIRRRALETFEVLARAEGAAHGVDPDEVHFHEVGALDAIADVVGNCAALEDLGVEMVTASPVAVGSGRVRTSHGDTPVPVPAVAQLLIGWQSVPVAEASTPAGSQDQERHPGETHHHHHARRPDHNEVAEGLHHDHEHAHEHDHEHNPIGMVHAHGGRIEGPAPVMSGVGELATPTGMALIRTLAAACEPLGALGVTGLGVGAGGRDFPGRPNVVRVVLGGNGADGNGASITELAANVDDLDPRLWPDVLESCLGAGALDAWLVPIHMKKGRPAFTVHALVQPEARDRVVESILSSTTTLGVREVGVTRTVLDRLWVDVDVEGFAVPVKIGHRGGCIVNAAVEFDALPGLAAHLAVAPADALARATAALVAGGLVIGSPVPQEGARGVL